MNRRQFVQSAGLFCVTAMATKSRAWAEVQASDGWRTFEVITRVEVPRSSGITRIWLPAALTVDTPYQKTLRNTFDAPGGTAKSSDHPSEALGIVIAEFPADVAPVLSVTSLVTTRNYVIDLSRRGSSPAVARATLQPFLRATKLLPTDGIVRETAMSITAGAKTDIDKARAIYEWIVENTFRDPKTRGCGLGDIRFMLESRNLGGKCADLNALYVGLARAAGLPARDVYGLRVAKSDLGYQSLGAATANVTKAQHCRAEVYLTGYGWVPVDPADVRKVALEEPPGNRPLNDPMVKRARERLFGSWEMNWIAFNFAHDVVLPGSKGAPVAFLMYPQAETANGRLDSLDPETFKYEITSREVSSGSH